MSIVEENPKLGIIRTSHHRKRQKFFGIIRNSTIKVNHKKRAEEEPAHEGFGDGETRMTWDFFNSKETILVIQARKKKDKRVVFASVNTLVL